MSNEIINWNNVHQQSDKFKNNQPFRFAFIKEFINRNFYKKLYETFPQIDDSWEIRSDLSKYQYVKHWTKNKDGTSCLPDEDSRFSKEWNIFKQYCESDEFIYNFKKFSGIEISKLKHFNFTCYRKGGFQLSHIHNSGPSTLILMVYFSKNWKQGSAGGTFMATEEDEKSIIFEPYDLDNTMAIFHDGPQSAHGVRYISEDVTRQAIQIMLEGYSEEAGWTGGTHTSIAEKRFEKAIEL